MKTELRLTVIILLLAVFNLTAATHYVSLGSTNPTPPFTNWVTAATNIQDAVDAAAAGDKVVVTNGGYAGGVIVTNPLTLLSVNGPQFTVINGGGTNRCASLTDGASLTGFTLTNGVGLNGGGVSCTSTNAFLTNCLITGNSAYYVTNSLAGWGGGAWYGTLYNCTLSGNHADGGGGAIYSTLYYCTLTGNWSSGSGGGAIYSTLYYCTLTNNSSLDGGGAIYCTLYNCALTFNLAAQRHGGGAYGCMLYNCTLSGNRVIYGDGGGAYTCGLWNCTLTGNLAVPLLTGPNAGGGSGGGACGCNLNNCIVYFNYAANGPNYYLDSMDASWTDSDPLFVDYASGNLRLQSNSPCINAGNNFYVTTATDLDGRPRIVGGTVDIGAYEFQPSVSGAFIGWLQQYGLPTDGSADFSDADRDAMNNWQEWICGTNPTNRLSVLRLLSPSSTGTNATVTWQSVAGVNYSLERSANLAAPFTPLATNIIGQAGTTGYADTNATSAGPFFYRVGVMSP